MLLSLDCGSSADFLVDFAGNIYHNPLIWWFSRFPMALTDEDDFDCEIRRSISDVFLARRRA